MRKTKEEAELTRQSLMNAAEHLFIEKGLSRTTHNDIATRAGVTRGALNWHFPEGKTSILAALLERKRQMTERLAAHLSQCEQLAHTPVTIMRLTLVQDLESLARDTRLQRILLLTSSRNEFIGEFAWVNDQLDLHMRECRDMISQTFSRGMSCGEITLRNDLTPDMAASMLLSCIKGMVTDWLLKQSLFELPNDSEKMVSTLLESVVIWQHGPVS
ncbi:TetR family transcriptional regulator [Kushneria pakistanensis]|uniref:TetR family transcriptional regulator n=1 Tax=Kushneria pakistanensis TaxID=1508770 RepID=A0ABQ3FJ92_9GAMM|nr:TetR family transcriptional regulator [Kushneria pakistanensis]GHC26202.1 TetR family transcriptional regulator [Kushneria pakistanensis]